MDYKKVKKAAMVISSAAVTFASVMGGVKISGASLKTYTMADLIACDKAKIIGRYRMENTAITALWAGNGFDINVKCKRTAILQVHCSTNDKAFLAVFIDGKIKPRADMITESCSFITVTVPKGEHTVRVIRDTQITRDPEKYFNINCIKFNGEILEKPADKKLYIEVIGDSIACGDGANGKYESGKSWKDPEDHSFVMGFAYKLASMLGADYSVVARGGIGLLGDTSGSQEAAASSKIPMQDIYDLTNGYTDIGSGREPYAFERKPDLVVLELSGNDTTTMEDVWKQKVIDFVNHIREKNGSDVPIVWSGRSTVHCDTILSIINEKLIENGNFYSCYYLYGGSGAAALKTQTAGHPSAAEQTKIAENMVNFLKKQGVIDMAEIDEVKTEEIVENLNGEETATEETATEETATEPEVEIEETESLAEKARKLATPKNAAIAGGALVAGIAALIGIKKLKKKK